MRRLVPLAAVLGALVALPAPAPATSHGLHVCPNDAPFNIAIYVKGGTCEHALAVLSVWRTPHAPCQQHSTCRISHHFHDVGYRTYGCSQSYNTDHRGRQYWAIA